MSKIKVKHIKIGNSSHIWMKCILSDAVEINPKRELKKGLNAKFVSMADLKEFGKKIHGYTVKEYMGGSKFINGDTLMARITPCLENGKTAYVDILEDNEIGCGSTEFIVLSGRDGKSTSQFVYYLAKTPEIRQTAIQSMTGTSGRQRVETGIFDKVIINLPELSEQKAIAKILSDLDEKIELNHQMNRTLEAIGQAIFKHWFMDSEFTDSIEWEKVELGNYIQFIKGKKPSHVSETQLAGYRPQILINNLNGNPALYADGNGLIIVEIDEPIMVMDGASSGRVEIGHRGILGSTLSKVIVISSRLSNLFLYYYLKNKTPDINQNTTGTSIPHTDKDKIKKYQCRLPPKSILDKFNKIAAEFVNKMIENKHENELLIQIRDSILPKLMSGAIRLKG